MYHNTCMHIVCVSVNQTLEKVNCPGSTDHILHDGSPCIEVQIFGTCIGSADIVMNATSEVYMVLPYYRKGTLHDYLNIRSLTNSLLQVADILRLFYYVCDAVKYLHEFTPEPLAHRDLKTANVCLTDDLNPIVMDLGKFSKSNSIMYRMSVL